MKRFVSRFLAPLVVACAAASAHAFPVDIVSLTPRGDCAAADVRIVQEGSRYYVSANFGGTMVATADTVSNQVKNCIMDMAVRLAPGYALDLFEFSTNGVYQLSQQGTARLTVQHRVANGPSARTTKFFSRQNGDAAFGDIHDYTGTIRSTQLQPEFRTCGARIPLTTTIFAQATKPQSDFSGLTQISLDDGVSNHYTRLCYIVIRPC